jgi:hypothetical protein
MAARRSTSVGGERRRKHKSRLTPETVAELKKTYDSENLRSKNVAPMFLDSRGNAMSVNSTGHIHHPYNLSTSWRWARLVELLLESATFGVRSPLRMTCWAVQSSYARVEGASVGDQGRGEGTESLINSTELASSGSSPRSPASSESSNPWACHF